MRVGVESLLWGPSVGEPPPLPPPASGPPHPAQAAARRSLRRGTPRLRRRPPVRPHAGPPPRGGPTWSLPPSARSVRQGGTAGTVTTIENELNPKLEKSSFSM